MFGHREDVLTEPVQSMQIELPFPALAGTKRGADGSGKHSQFRREGLSELSSFVLVFCGCGHHDNAQCERRVTRESTSSDDTGAKIATDATSSLHQGFSLAKRRMTHTLPARKMRQRLLCLAEDAVAGLSTTAWGPATQMTHALATMSRDKSTSNRLLLCHRQGSCDSSSRCCEFQITYKQSEGPTRQRN